MKDTDARQDFKRITENLALAANLSHTVSAPLGSSFYLNQRGWFFPGYPRVTRNALWMLPERREFLIDLVHEPEVRRHKCPAAGNEE